MPNSGVEPLEIHLESSDLVLRGLSGEELEPAVLNGELVLTLQEATNLKEIQLTFNGVAKVTWRDSSTHHYDHPLFFHDFHFLNPGTSSTSSSKTPHPTHTLKAGRHVFPFSLHVPGSLPASIRTYSGTCATEYKLKATATRPGFAADWKSRKVVRIARGFGVDAVEYNQTLEIENTWPGKVMYAFTIPHKAYAAGDTIPVSVKFSPLAKGVRIVSLITTIREHTTVHSKSSSHSEARDATVVKYNFIPDGSTPASGTVSPHPARIESSASLASMNVGSGASTPTTPGFGIPHGNGWPGTGSGHGTPEGTPVASGSSWPQRMQRNPNDLAGEGEPFVPDENAQEEIDDGMDTEVDVVVDVPVPIWTAPTHSVFPVFVNHKIKWSAFIKNPDGHVSELRCALPIHILASSLAEEARLASAGSRNLLFGESGVLAHSDVPQVDLPSYQDHIRDRVANADTASYFSLAAGFTPTPWSCRTPGGTLANPLATPMASPPASRPPSRPASPVRGQSSRFPPSGRSSGTVTPVTGPTSPAGEMEEHPEDHRNWIDSELMNTLSLDPISPPGSNPASRPGSRPPSRPASPDRELHHAHGSASPSHDTSPANGSAEAERPPALSRNSSFFHLHIPKPLRPLTSFSRNASSSSLSAMGGSNSPSASALSNALAAHAAKSGPGGPGGRTYETHTHSAMSNSPTQGLSAAASPMSTSPETQSFFPPASSYHNSHISTSAHSHSSHSSLPPHLQDRSVPQTPGAQNPSPGSTTPYGYPEDRDIDFLSQVPSYDVAARGFLGGGVVPLSVNASLPNYEDLREGARSA